MYFKDFNHDISLRNLNQFRAKRQGILQLFLVRKQTLSLEFEEISLELGDAYITGDWGDISFLDLIVISIFKFRDVFCKRVCYSKTPNSCLVIVYCYADKKVLQFFVYLL